MSFIMELPDNEGNRILAEALKMIAGVPEHRMARDKKRAELLSDDVYDCKIENNGTKAEFFEKVETIYNNLLEKAKEYGW